MAPSEAEEPPRVRPPDKQAAFVLEVPQVGARPSEAGDRRGLADPFLDARADADERAVAVPVSFRRFVLERKEDVSGVSGTGLVAYGVEFPDGQCVLCWWNFGTIGVYKSARVVEEVHGHEGKTQMRYTDSD